MHVQIDLVTDADVGVLGCAVGEGVKGESDGAVGRVFKGDDAVGGVAGLDAVKDFWMGD